MDEKITIQTELHLKKATRDYFFNGRYILWGTIFYLQRKSDPKVFDGPFVLQESNSREMKEWLALDVVWVKDNFKNQ